MTEQELIDYTLSLIPKEEKEIRQGGKAICLNYRTSGIWHRNMRYQ